ncbi:MAG: HAD family hydrolase [Chitinophagaceae bacterium]
MASYQHYSFDLWLTLIRSNPSFKQERAAFFYQHFNGKKKPLEEVQLAFRQVDLMCNAINEKTGGNIDAEEMYLMVISMINDHDIALKDIDITTLYDEMDDLLLRHLPGVYCGRTAGVLDALKQQDTTLNILSNTGFIKGKTLRQVLSLIGLSGYFDFQLYSDELGMSKPSKHLFQHLLQHITEIKKGEIDRNLIIHVGDNPVADVEGARAVGINSLLVNSNQTSILTLLN